MSIQLPTFTTDVNIHQSLADQPTMTATELKQAWDSPASAIKTYLNNTLIPAIETELEALSDIADTVNSVIQEKLEARYYVGSIIVSSIAKDPSTYLGFGTWELTGKGQVEIGVDPTVTRFNDGGKTGGTFSKTLTSANIPQMNLNKQSVTNVTGNTNNNADLTLPSGRNSSNEFSTVKGNLKGRKRKSNSSRYNTSLCNSI